MDARGVMKFRRTSIIRCGGWYDSGNMDTPSPTLASAAPAEISAWIGNAEEFPILRNWDFFNHAAVSPLPHRVAQAVQDFCTQAEQQAYLGQHWHQEIDALRGVAGRLINAQASEIAFIKNTSEGIATVAGGIDWHPGDRIVTTAVEFPANIYPWMDVAKRSGVELVLVAEETGPDGARRVPLDKLLAAADDSHTRLLALSHVQYASGQRNDLARIGGFCRDNGIYFCIDAIQSIGVTPVDVAAMKIDFLSADGHKWMMGPEGAGVFYCRKELLESMDPLIVGWLNMVNSQNFGQYEFALKPDARRFECGCHNVAGLLGLKAALDMLDRIGIAAIAQRVKTLTDRLIVGISRKGYRVLSPRQEGEDSGIVSFMSPRGGHESLLRTLQQDHHIELSLREGRVRCSPHFYNTEAQIDRLIDLLPGQ